jgi:hypothetical protein
LDVVERCGVQEQGPAMFGLKEKIDDPSILFDFIDNP